MLADSEPSDLDAAALTSSYATVRTEPSRSGRANILWSPGVTQSAPDSADDNGRLGPRMASSLRDAFAAALPRPMYRITCPSSTQLHASSQVLAVHRGLMYRIIGHYLR
jgi:hypothetical protein